MSKPVEQEAVTRQLVHAVRRFGKDKTILVVVATSSEIKIAAHGDPAHVRDVLHHLTEGFDAAKPADLEILRQPNVVKQ
jgi:hypothetical protein